MDYDKVNKVLAKINTLQSNLTDSSLSSEAKNESARLLESYKREFKRHSGMSYEAARALADR